MKDQIAAEIENLLPDEATAAAEIESLLQGAETDLEKTLAEMAQKGQQQPRSGRDDKHTAAGTEAAERATEARKGAFMKHEQATDLLEALREYRLILANEEYTAEVKDPERMETMIALERAERLTREYEAQQAH